MADASEATRPVMTFEWIERGAIIRRAEAPAEQPAPDVAPEEGGYTTGAVLALVKLYPSLREGVLPHREDALGSLGVRVYESTLPPGTLAQLLKHDLDRALAALPPRPRRYVQAYWAAGNLRDAARRFGFSHVTFHRKVRRIAGWMAAFLNGEIAPA